MAFVNSEGMLISYECEELIESLRERYIGVWRRPDR